MTTSKSNIKAAKSHSAVSTLKLLGRRHIRKLVLTFTLVILENLTYLFYPLLAGFAINAVVSGNGLHALLYTLMVLAMWLIGATRRSIDTRTFARIYAEMAVPVIISQRLDNQPVSTIAARVALSREFTDFFEKHLPVFFTAILTIAGAAGMLIFIQFWTGVACLLILLVFSLFLKRFTARNDALFLKLNDRLEKEVSFLGVAGQRNLKRHYDIIARLRIALSDREAAGYLLIGGATAMLFTYTLLSMSHSDSRSAGHIYSVMTYVWMFASSINGGPQLMEKYSQLKDIGKRISTSSL